MRELAKAGVLVGFCGGGGTPLFSANEVDVEVAWLTPQSEYRPTEYLQAWVKFWFDDDLAPARRQAAANQPATAPAAAVGHAGRCVKPVLPSILGVCRALVAQFTQRSPRPRCDHAAH